LRANQIENHKRCAKRHVETSHRAWRIERRDALHQCGDLYLMCEPGDLGIDYLEAKATTRTQRLRCSTIYAASASAINCYTGDCILNCKAASI
jgi:hypothetical protein